MNPHALRRLDLNQVRLPISPRPQVMLQLVGRARRCKEVIAEAVPEMRSDFDVGFPMQAILRKMDGATMRDRLMWTVLWVQSAHLVLSCRFSFLMQR